jgi:hypothetical protein
MVIELGRYIVGERGVYVTEIAHRKVFGTLLTFTHVKRAPVKGPRALRKLRK